MNTDGRVATALELLVHETAHLHLRAAQETAPLVDPARGPLSLSSAERTRASVRVLLVWHALAYMRAVHADVVAAGLLRADTVRDTVEEVAAA